MNAISNITPMKNSCQLLDRTDLTLYNYVLSLECFESISWLADYSFDADVLLTYELYRLLKLSMEDSF